MRRREPLTRERILEAAMALADAEGIDAVTSPFVMLFVHPTLPLPGGDRIVQIRNRDVVANEAEPPALHDFLVWREGEGSPGLSRATNEVSIASIDPSYFDVLGAPILAGRGFDAADLAPDARAVIVDQDFVDQVLLGRNAVGRRVRFTRERRGGTLSDDARPWYEIVGVVDELRMDTPHRGRTAGPYLPEAPGSAGPLELVVHVKGDPMSFAPRLRAMATAVDPALRRRGHRPGGRRGARRLREAAGSAAAARPAGTLAKSGRAARGALGNHDGGMPARLHHPHAASAPDCSRPRLGCSPSSGFGITFQRNGHVSRPPP